MKKAKVTYFRSGLCSKEFEFSGSWYNIVNDMNISGDYVNDYEIISIELVAA